MPYTDIAKHLMLDALCRDENPTEPIGDASLHTAFPGSTGASEVSGGAPAYARKSITFNKAAAGSSDSSNQPVFDVPASTTIRFVGYFAAGSPDVFLAYAPIGNVGFIDEFSVDVTNDEIYFCVDATVGAAIWKRASSASGGWIVHTVDAGIVASVTQTQAGGTSVTGERVEVLTVANSNDAVTLPTASVGRDCFIFNSGINTLQVFPAVSDTINNLGVNLSVTIAPNTGFIFSAVDATGWYTR